MRMRAIVFGAVAILLLPALDCSSGPQSPACSNDHECEAYGGSFHYCLNSRCVECVTNAACGNGHRCVDGACVEHE